MNASLTSMRTRRLSLLRSPEPAGARAEEIPLTTWDYSTLTRELARLTGDAKHLCTLLGMTSDWGVSTWVAAGTPGEVLPTFHVRVHGTPPTSEVLRLLTRRLGRHGWHGKVLAEGPTTRLEATRDDLSMRLVAHRQKVTLVVQRDPIDIGAPLARALLAGVFEQEAESA